MKCIEKGLDGNYIRMLRAEKISEAAPHKTAAVWPPDFHLTNNPRRTRHAVHGWKSKNELINDVFIWTPTRGLTSVGQLARTFKNQLMGDTGCSLEDQPRAMDRAIQLIRGISLNEKRPIISARDIRFIRRICFTEVEPIIYSWDIQ